MGFLNGTSPGLRRQKSRSSSGGWNVQDLVCAHSMTSNIGQGTPPSTEKEWCEEKWALRAENFQATPPHRENLQVPQAATVLLHR